MLSHKSITIIIIIPLLTAASGCIHYGVSQGSLLCPRLCSIFVNDLPICVGDIGDIYICLLMKLPYPLC